VSTGPNEVINPKAHSACFRLRSFSRPNEFSAARNTANCWRHTSRRTDFVQQLGRGIFLKRGKCCVKILDRKEERMKSDEKPEVESGVAVRFDSLRGFGFIRADKDRQQCFCHHTEIMMEGFRILEPGQRVVFVRTMVAGRACPVATEVHIQERVRGTTC
jgi:CspA family cold shock protein